jgi:two-component system response regulator QseB
MSVSEIAPGDKVSQGHILVAEDRQHFGEQIVRRLRAHYSIDFVAGVSALRNAAVSRLYALIIVGTDATYEERLELIRNLRNLAIKARILVLADQSGVHELVQTLEVGADDYLRRPFHMDELAARVKALLRRIDSARLNRVRAGRLELADDGQIYCAGAPMELHDAERRLLWMLMLKAGRLVNKAMIEGTLADDVVSANAVEQRVSRLRMVLNLQESSIRIRTIRGSGYVLESQSPKPLATSHENEAMHESAMYKSMSVPQLANVAQAHSVKHSDD